MTHTARLVHSETLLQPLGRAFITACYAAGQSLRIYPVENTTVQNALDELERTAGRILERESTIDLRHVGDFFFLNDVRLRLDLADYVVFSYLSGLLRRHDVGHIVMERGVRRADLTALLSLLLEEPPAEGAFDRFRQRLHGSTGRAMTVAPRRAGDAPRAETEASRAAARRTYFQSVHVAREVLTDTRLGRAVNLRRVKRAVQAIVDQVLNNESSIVGMTALRDFDQYTFTHSVNVCIFSVVIGQKLGLSKTQLFELGLGALFHDIGKQRLRPELVNKTTPLTEAEWREVMQHPTEGLLTLFTTRGLSEVPYRAMLLAYEHHMKLDLTGYPRSARPRQPTIFSRIVAVADGFDAATSKRSYQQQPWPPDEVLREMRDNPLRGYDPLLVKALINVTGVFPVGTLAILDTQELAVVVARNPDPLRLHQPIVRIVSDAMGMRLADPPTVDLAELDAATGEPRRTIIKTTQPERYGIRVSDYFH